jgi:integrase
MASVRKRKWTHKGVEREAWVVTYTDQVGTRRMKTFEKKKDADAHRAKVEVELGEGVHLSGVVAKPIRHVVEQYIRSNEQRRADGRIGYNRMRDLRNTCVNHIIPFFGSMVLDRLTLSVYEDFHRISLAKGLQPQSSVRFVKEMKRIEEFGIERRWGSTRVAALAMKQLRGIQAKPIPVPTPDQVRSLLAASVAHKKFDQPRMRALVACTVHLGALCGLRFGEIAGLCREDVNIPDREITVRHSLTYDDVLKEPKTKAGYRVVNIPPIVSNMLVDWIDNHMATEARGLMFRHRHGGMLSPATFWTRWRRLQLLAGVITSEDDDGFRFHSLRHFVASHMIDLNMPLTDVAQLLGHKKFDTTLQIYAHPMRSSAARRSAFDQMAEALGRSDTRQDCDNSAQVVEFKRA